MQNDKAFAHRRIVRTNRLLSEVGHTDIIEALEELKSLQAASQPFIEADAKRPWVCMCGMKHFKPYDGLKCQCGAVYRTA